MSVIHVDIIIKTAIEAGLADLRKNSWLLDDIFGGLHPGDIASDSLTNLEYGYKEVAAAKKWFLSTDIPVLLPFRMDVPIFPCITVTRGPSTELINRTVLADYDGVQELDITRISPTIHRIYQSVTPIAYNYTNGIVTLPDTHPTDILSSGQYLVSSKSGKGYEIKAILNRTQIQISNNINDDFTNAYIIPAVALWNINRERTFFQETLYIGCHAQSDPSQCRWLHTIIVYLLLRYKEAYLEGRGIALTTFSSNEMIQNPNFNPEIVFTQTVTLTGHVETNWCKFIAPRLSRTTGKIVIADGPQTPPGYREQINDTEGIYMSGDVVPSSNIFIPTIGVPLKDDE